MGCPVASESPSHIKRQRTWSIATKPQRQVKYLNNGIESDHVPIKKLIIATGGFKIRKRAWSTIQGFESLRMLNKGQFDFWLRNDERQTLVRERSAFMNRLFNVDVVFQ